FTLSQAGMVAHWREVGGPGARGAVAINAAGAACTAGALRVVLGFQFAGGAGGMLLLFSGVLVVFLGVGAPRPARGREVASTAPLDATALKPPLVLLPIRGWSAITRKALRFALKISPEIYALHVADDEKTMADLEDTWGHRVHEPATAAGLPTPKLIVIYSPYRKLYSPPEKAIPDRHPATPR